MVPNKLEAWIILLGIVGACLLLLNSCRGSLQTEMLRGVDVDCWRLTEEGEKMICQSRAPFPIRDFRDGINGHTEEGLEVLDKDFTFRSIADGEIIRTIGKVEFGYWSTAIEKMDYLNCFTIVVGGKIEVLMLVKLWNKEGGGFRKSFWSFTCQDGKICRIIEWIC